ncbi:hypothetical protein [Teichococcus wenyumeiae]|nr:hypothetical protein [Pseudoroseomonas wenyumeiae]
MQSDPAADRSASLARPGNQPARYNYAWPVRTVDDHLARVLASRKLREQVYARRGEVPLDLIEEVLAMEVVRLRRELEERGSFY